MGLCISKNPGPTRHATTARDTISTNSESTGSASTGSPHHHGLSQRHSAGPAAPRQQTRFSGDVDNTLFFGRRETQECLMLWAHGGDPAELEKSYKSKLIMTRQLLGGNALFDPQEKCPELNQAFANHLRADPKRRSAVNEDNRENFSEEKPDMSIAICMGIRRGLGAQEQMALEQQAALNETEVFSRKSKGSISFAVKYGRDVAFGLSGVEEMTSAPAKERFFKSGYDAKTSVTDSELRFLYRNRNDPNYQERVKFYQEQFDTDELEFKECAPPWELHPQAWAQYKPKSEG